MKKLMISLTTILLTGLLACTGLTAFASDIVTVSRVNGKMMIGDQIVYCYDKSKSAPQDGTQYQPMGTYNGESVSPEKAEQIRRLLYAGYPFDGYGLFLSLMPSKQELENDPAFEKSRDAYAQLGYENAMRNPANASLSKEEKEALAQAAYDEMYAEYLGDTYRYIQTFDYYSAVTQYAVWTALGQYTPSPEVIPAFELRYINALLEKSLQPITAPVGQLAFVGENGAEQLYMNEQEDGSYRSDLFGFSGYTGSFSLNVPADVKVVDAGGNAADPAALQTNTQYRLISAGKPSMISISSADYVYRVPDEVYFYEPLPGGNTQRLIGVSSTEASVPGTLVTVAVTERLPDPELPLEPPVELPDEEPPLAGPGTGLPDADLPLTGPEQDPSDNVVLEDPDLPLAPPKTGDGFASGMWFAVFAGSAVLALGGLGTLLAIRKYSRNK